MSTNTMHAYSSKQLHLPSVVEMETAAKHSTRSVFSSVPIACSEVAEYCKQQCMHSRLSSYLCRCIASLYSLSLARVMAYHTLLCWPLCDSIHQQYSLCLLYKCACSCNSGPFVVHYCMVGICLSVCCSSMPMKPV